MNPVILQIGSAISVSWYGFLIVIGSLLCAWIAAQYAGKSGERKDHIWNLLGIVLIFGIIGARAYHIISTPAYGGGWPYYRENPSEMWNFWNGGFRGLGIYGGLLGGSIGLLLYCLVRRLDPVKYLDFIAPTLLLGQAIGRIGNYINQELYGQPSNLPWAFHINPQFDCQLPQELMGALAANIQACGITNFISNDLTTETIAWYASNGFHPTFFYEAIWNLLGFVLLIGGIYFMGHKLRRGDGPLLYLIIYSVGRLWIELFRPDAWMLGPLAAAQWIALLMITVAGMLLLVRHSGWTGQSDPDASLILMSGKGVGS